MMTPGFMDGAEGGFKVTCRAQSELLRCHKYGTTQAVHNP